MRHFGWAILLDLDQTLVLTDGIEPLRRARQWPTVYRSFDRTTLPAGTRAFLERAKDLAAVGVVTTSPRPYAERLLDYHELDIPVLVAYHDVSNRKPHPEPILKAAEILQVPVSRCIHVGDSESDADSSSRAGAITVVATWGAARKFTDNRVQAVCTGWNEVMQFVESRIRARVVGQEG